MKLLTYRKGEAERLGVLTAGGKILPIEEADLEYKDMNDLVCHITQAEQKRLSLMAERTEGGIDPELVGKCAPIPHPLHDIICLGVNYIDHAAESARFKKESFDGTRKWPVYFGKHTDRCTADGEPIPSHGGRAEQLDYEVELAVILGKEAKNVAAADAFDYVFGYTIINDVSCRLLQNRHKQFYFGKSLDGFCPMGPVIVTADELGTPPVRQLRSFVNNELRQDSMSDRMLFDIPYIISELSALMTLPAGSIIATGTPAGVGMGFEPPRFLVPGDVVRCEIEGIGSISNTVE